MSWQLFEIQFIHCTMTSTSQMNLGRRNMDKVNKTVKEIWSMSRHVRTSRDENMAFSSL